MKTFYIKTLGCKVNRYESDGIATELIESGYKRAETIQDAQTCIINTCTVTSRAGMQSRQAIRKIIKTNPHAKIIVTGCHAEVEPGLINKIDNIDAVVGHENKFKIGEMVKTGSIIKEDKKKGFKPFKHLVRGKMTRAYLKIQDGCNSCCTYCIIPRARGRSSSMEEKDIITNLKKLGLSGCNEAVLTGIHLGAWGRDLNPHLNFSSLLNNLMKLKSIPRLRISSIEPNELTDTIISLAKNSHKLCDHFHIPLQSGDDTILKKMKRPYDTIFFKSLIDKINTILPRVSIGLDVIAGFPGETEEHFINTYSFIKDLKISYLHVFPFSPRKGTKAFEFNGQVNNSIIKSRCSLLRKLSREKKKEFEKSMININLKGVVQTRRDKTTGLLVAVTSNYLSVLLKGDDDLKGKIIGIIPEKWDKDKRLHGKIN